VSDHEFFMRCDCGAEFASIDIWLKPGADPVDKGAPKSGTYPIESFEDGYLTFYNDIVPMSRLRGRLRLAWNLLRGRDATYACVILNPEAVTRLRDFLAAFTGAPPQTTSPTAYTWTSTDPRVKS
jgi:hypothetical protein